MAQGIKTGGRPRAKDEEYGLLGPDFLDRLWRIGPRESESAVAFAGRLGALREGRRVILEAMLKSNGSNSTLAALLGVHQSNLKTVLFKHGIGGRRMQDPAVLQECYAALEPMSIMHSVSKTEDK